MNESIEQVIKKWKKVWAYTRYSSELQEGGYSTETQHKAIQDFASQHGITITKWFDDKAESGKSIEREKFYALNREIRELPKENRPDAILIYHTSRWGRGFDSDIAEYELEKLNVSVVSITQLFMLGNEPGQFLIKDIMRAIDKYKSRVDGMFTKANMSTAAEKGYNCGGTAPDGYMIVKIADPDGKRNKKGEIKLRNTFALDDKPGKFDKTNKPRWELIKTIFELYSNVHGLKTIAQKVFSMGWRSKTGAGKDHAIGASAIRAYIQNIAYTGTLEWADIKCENAFPAIVDKETFEFCQKRFQKQKENWQEQIGGKTNYKAQRLSSTKYLCSGIVYCGVCGSHYIVNSREPEKRRYAFYFCDSKKRHGVKACNNINIPVLKLESQIIEDCIQIMFRKESIDQFVQEYNEKLRIAREDSDPEYRNILKDIASIDEELNNYKQALAISKGSNLKTIVEAISQAEEQKETLLKRKKEIEEYQHTDELYYNHALMEQRLSEYKKILLEGDFEARQDVIRTYVKNITVFPANDIKITYSPAVNFLEGKECRPMVGAGRGI